MTSLFFLIKWLFFLYYVWLISAQGKKGKDIHKEHPHWQSDWTGRHEKVKLRNITEDLVRDSVLKLRQILDIRVEHEFFTAYGVGVVIGRIREKYRFMLEVYRDIYDAHINKSNLVPPGISMYRPIHYIIALEMMHTLESEIDKLVDVLIETATDDMEKDVQMLGQRNVAKRQTLPPDPNMYHRKHNVKRAGQQRTAEQIVREEMQKSSIRQRYLMRKLGQPPNSTTMKKRFQKHWPVEDTWSLDKYNQFY